MMYILSGDKKQIINSDFVERFCISKMPGCGAHRRKL